MSKTIRTLTKCLLLVLAALTSTGCSILKAPSTPDHLWTPPKWEKTTKKPDEVWMELRTRKVGASGNLKLIELINIALANNPGILQAYYTARAAHAALKQAESTWYPQITASGDFTKDRRDANLRSDRKNTRSYEGGLDATMLALDFGGRAATVKEAYHELIAANYDYNQAIQDVILNAEDAYFTLYSAKANLEAAEANVQDLTDGIRSAFRTRTIKKFVIVSAKSEADIVFSGTVTQYVWEKDAPVTMPLPAGMVVDYLTKKGKHYARMLLHYKLTDAKGNKVLKENTVMATLKRRGVTKEKSYQILDKRMPNMLMRDICKKSRDEE